MPDRITRFCIVRHGETAWNAEHRMQGHRDLPLSAEGEQQAQEAAQYFRERHFAAIYCSDLMRAQQTARPIAETLQLPVTLLAALRERNYGRCEGLVRGEVDQKYKDDARALRNRDPDYRLPGGETLRQHQQRVLDCISQLALRHTGQTVLVVTHGGSLDLIYRRAQGIALEKTRDFPIPNTGINWLRVDGEEWHVELWGQIAHLGERGALEVRTNF